VNLTLDNHVQKRYLEVECWPIGVELAIGDNQPGAVDEQVIFLTWEQAGQLVRHIERGLDESHHPETTTR